MNKFLKYTGITVISVLVVLYGLFLIVPFFLTGVINSYSDNISKAVEKSCGFKIKLEKMKIVTTPKLTAGAKVGHIDIMLPTGESFLTADNVQGKMSLLPLFLRKIELDMVGADNINLNLKVKKDGKFLIEDYIPRTDSDNASAKPAMTGLPFGFKLSNHLPDIILNNYNISFIDIPTDKSYSIYGNNAQIKDFILNKKVKVSIAGKILLQDKTQFNYDVNILNRIMPDVDLNDLVFNPQEQNNENNGEISLNIIDIFKAIHDNQLTANVTGDVKTSGTIEEPHFNGYLNVQNLGVAVYGKKLPASNVDFTFKGHKIKLYSKLYTADKEITEVVGKFKTGKHPKINLNCKSNAQFNSVIRLADSVAKTFGYNDLSGLSATGGIDSDFNIISNLKSIESSGYLKIPSASIAYAPADITVNNINADVDLSNNMVNIKNAGLSVLGQPLKIKGTISQKAEADISVIADKLQLKGLLLAAGQMQMLKENSIKTGTLSMNTILKGRLDKIVPKINLSIDNVNIKNIPSNTVVTVLTSKIDISTDGKKTQGGVNVKNAKVINPAAAVSMPDAKITLGDKDISIDSAYILLNNSRIDITGKVYDYMTKKIKFAINAKGALLASDIRSMIPSDLRQYVTAKGKLPLSVNISGDDKNQDIIFSLNANPANYVSILSVDQLRGKSTIIKGNVKLNGDSLKFSDAGIYGGGTGLVYLKGGIADLYKSQKLNLNLSTPNNISIVIPGFKKSKVVAGGNIDVSGTALNPILSGRVSVPSLSIPEMLLTMQSMDVNLNGPVAKGNGTLKKFVSGGIVAENLASDFSLKNNVFYLKNITGNAFDGKVNGNVSYNIMNGHTGVIFSGSSMNAQKAFEGAAGLKNALSGTLGFNANVTLYGATDVEMIKNLKGKVSFDIKDGTLGNIGRFENFLYAPNITSNSILKSTVNSISALPTIENTSHFKTITGNMTFNGGWAYLNPVKYSGPSMAYYIKGRYNILNSTANVVVLGRISADVVKLLGPLGDLSVTKLTSYIPKFGKLTGNLINALTTDPKSENTALIPQLSSGNKNYKDFKVTFNGGVESRSSVKSFKWLSKCDTSAIESVSLKEQVKQTKQAFQEAKQEKIDAFNKHLEEQRQQAQESKQQMQDAVNGLKNLKNLLK